jgi:hypothetical protein
MAMNKVFSLVAKIVTFLLAIFFVSYVIWIAELLLGNTAKLTMAPLLPEAPSSGEPIA